MLLLTGKLTLSEREAMSHSPQDKKERDGAHVQAGPAEGPSPVSHVTEAVGT